MNLVRIETPDDPRIAAYRDIRERDLAGRDGLFIAEGKVVLNVLFGARRFRARSALILENRLAGMEDTLAMADPAMPVHVASRQVMDAIAGFPVHRGILALGERRDGESPSGILPPPGAASRIVALAGIANHDNMGAIFRNAAAFGADAVLLDDECCDPLYRKAIRVSVGAALKVPFARAGTASAMADTVLAAGYRLLALSPSGSTSLRDIAPRERTAILLGTEGEGLPSDLMARLETVRIPMRRDFDSLNVATAGAIALGHVFRDEES
ncbi:RNA methyltransferase [Zhengella mangrovi]|uniref:RNA methyltransferase n=1 Tax=Zhengella mangrovi TaxID=1982044 RepID=A0A2G1QP68_9HYPH|nr:RNA methyltransferase [Zhengella mangrovi]PHP67302.1 RNA methyltransferase [Zhengella mangrovi]